MRATFFVICEKRSKLVITEKVLQKLTKKFTNFVAAKMKLK